jgi:hypothetical protein
MSFEKSHYSLNRVEFSEYSAGFDDLYWAISLALELK